MIRPNNFRVTSRRLAMMAGAVPVVLVAIMVLYRPAWLSGLERASYDVVLRWADPGPISSQVLIVDVDDRSLAAIGQWPWRRDVIGTLVSRLRQMGASAIVLDILFAEPDRYGPPADSSDTTTHAAIAGASQIPNGTDSALAAALGGGRVLLGYALTFGKSQAGRDCVLHPIGVAVIRDSGDGPPFFRASGATCGIPILARAAGSSGFLNAAPDADGILRRVPLLLEFNGQIYPSLALAAVMTVTTEPAAALRVANVDTAVLELGDRRVPLDGKSHLLLRYYGMKRTFQYVSAADVLAHRLKPDVFANKLVFVGATALGTSGDVSTPFDTLVPGVEVQATIADNLLSQRFIQRSEYSILLEILAVFLLGSIVVAALRTGDVAWSGLCSLGCILTAWWAGMSH